MVNPNFIKQIQAGFAAGDCYNRAVRAIVSGPDPKLGQLWTRWGDIMTGAAVFYANEIAREEAMIADYENMMAWENMPCGEEA